MYKHFCFLFFLSVLISSAIANNKKSESLKQALPLQEASSINRAEILSQLATEYFNNSVYAQSIACYKEAIAIYSSNQNLFKVALANQRLGEVFIEINDYTNATDNYLEALKIFESLGTDSMIIETNLSLADLSLSLDNYSKAMHFLNASLRQIELSKNLKSSKYTPRMYLMYGVVFGSTNKLDSAIFYFNKAMSSTSQKGNEIQYAGLLNNIGAIFSKNKNYNEALKRYQEALSIFQSINHIRGIGITLSNIAYVFYEQSKNKEATQYYYKSLGFLEKVKDLNALTSIYLHLSEIYESEKNYDKALAFHKKHFAASEQLKNSEVLTKIAALENQFEVKKKDQELVLLKEENKRKTITQILIVAGACLLLIIGLLVFRNLKISLKNKTLKEELLSQRNIKLSVELGHKKHELDYFALRIVEKNSLLEKLKDDLNSLDQNAEKPEQIKVITGSIKHNLFLDTDRKELDIQIDEVHKNFFLRLKEKHADLSKSETRLCSLLVMNLTSKDISNILNISPDSVKKARYRLRKKLFLKESDSLEEYLSMLIENESNV